MEKLIIAVDCDDVVVESVPSILRYYNTTYGTDVQLADFYGKDLTPWGVADDDIAIRRVNTYLESDEYKQLPPIQDAVFALRALKGLGHELHLVTGRADFLEAATRQWLARHFPDIFSTLEFTNYIVPRDRAHVSRTKAEVCNQLAADILIDDHLHHARLVADAGVQVLLFGDYPWNQLDDGESLPHNVTRVSGWPAVLEYFKTMN